MANIRERQRRERRRAVASARAAEVRRGTGLAVAQRPVGQRVSKNPAPVAPLVRGVRTIPPVLDARTKKTAVRKAEPVKSMARTVAPPALARAERRIGQKIAASPVIAGRKAPAPKLAVQKLAETSLAEPTKRRHLHGGASLHSTQSRRKDDDTNKAPAHCKRRPASSRPSSGGGKSRAFVPWCG